MVTLILGWGGVAALTPFGRSQDQNESSILAQTQVILEHQQAAVGVIKQSLINTGGDSLSQQVAFLVRLEQQIFRLAASIDLTVQAFGQPVYQSYKTKVCSESSNLIATGKAMVRLLKSSQLTLDSTQDFQLSIDELILVKRDLNC
jgi:hypothetical protein